MKILLISTPVFALPLKGYGGLEALVYNWAVEFAKHGHQVAVVAPGDSKLPEGMELISINLREGEDTAYMRYKNRLQSGEFQAIWDNTWGWHSVMAQLESDKQLPIVHSWHSDPYGLGSVPPIKYPMIVAFSDAQAHIIGRKFNCMVRRCYHGVDLNFYKPDPTVQRGDRYLWLARYCPEKGAAEAIYLAKKCRVGLDMYGDTEIIGGAQDYMRKCFQEAQQTGAQIRPNAGIPREETVKQYQSHKALITWPNYIECFGLSTVECLATGTPVITKDSGAGRELVEDGVSGFVVGTLEQAEDLIKTDAVSKIKPEDCRKQAEKFSIEKSAEGHLRILSDVGIEHAYW